MPSVNTEGIFPNDSIAVRAIMLWPNDEERRRHFYAAEYANGFVYEHDPSTDYVWRASLIQALLEAPSWSELKRDLQQCTKRAIVAGYVLTFMFLMDRLRDRLPARGAKGASLSKAIFLAQEWAKQGTTYGDGTAMFASEKSVKDCWRDYRSVSHLWAAMEMNKIAEFAPARELIHPEHFHKFMRAAAYLQMFGTTHTVDNKAKRTREVLLGPDSTWLVDVEKYRPSIMLPDDWSIFDDAPFMLMLKKYQA